MFLVLGAGLPVNRGVREFLLTPAIRQQAGSYKGPIFWRRGGGTVGDVERQAPSAP